MDSLSKCSVHNELEAKTLIEEAFSQGDETKYQCTKFYTHSGEYLFQTKIHLTEYEMVMPNGDSIYREIL